MAAPGQDQRQHVASIVAGVGEQRHGMRQHAVNCLNEHQSDIEDSGDGEGGSERGRRMAVVVVVVVTMMMTVVMLMRVMQRHGFDS